MEPGNLSADPSSSESESSNSREETINEHREFAKKLKTEQSKFNKNHKTLQEKLNHLLQQAEHYASFLFYGGATNNKTPVKSPVKKRLKRGKDEDELIHEMKHEHRFNRLTAQPTIMKNGVLRDYQIEGVNWLYSLYRAGINGILADEMGLGKTIQCISFLAYLREQEGIIGPHLIVVPKSTLGNWIKEFEKWCPIIRTVKLVAAKPYREEILKNEL